MATVRSVTYGWRREGGVIAEVCDECGFDGRQAPEVIAGIKAAVVAILRSLDDPQAGRRPAAQTWSAQEYANHTMLVVVECVTEVVGAAGIDVAAAPADIRELVGYLERFAARVEGRDLGAIRLETSFATISGTDNLLHALHDAEHHLLDIRRGYARLALARGEELQTTVR